MTNVARVLLVDENDDFLDGLAAWIDGCAGFAVAGVAHSADEAFERIDRLAPDMVLMSMTLPDLSGLEATRRMKSRPAAPLVVLMTFHQIGAGRAEALAAGADGCLAKPEVAREFAELGETLWRTTTSTDKEGRIR